MERYDVNVSENAKVWIERFQNSTGDINKERAAIQRIVSFVLDNWIGDALTGAEAKDMLTTLRNADSIVESLGE